MTITVEQLNQLEEEINAKLKGKDASFKFSMHFALDRVNDTRNKPPVTIEELRNIFNKVVDTKMESLLTLKDGDEFLIRCGTGHLNLPCELKKNGSHAQSFVITVMRKANFKPYSTTMKVLTV
ncbi:hypothetical protein [Vibrio sp. SCSIO 43136]|uniref:hypothetical protein n=1 Tax=Vibrio sp. SCSIO 43136 TaxID=2819101 RepID=UPI002075C043|nr:hypothetical protein [Vibrio sp. SCSIO 43136]USD64082.1 hypothetical protein J4N39_08085 [Vibrio sp. SCSIO 43136]